MGTSGSKDWMEVAAEVQKEVLVEYDIEPTEKALFAYRNAANKHGISLYVKYNRAREGDLKVGMNAPNVSLIGINGRAEQTSLLANQKADRPLVIIAGSIS